MHSLNVIHNFSQINRPKSVLKCSVKEKEKSNNKNLLPFNNSFCPTTPKKKINKLKNNLKNTPPPKKGVLNQKVKMVFDNISNSVQ